MEKLYKLNSYSSFGQYTKTEIASNVANICGKILSLAARLTETPDSYLGLSDASYEVETLRRAVKNHTSLDRLLLFREGGTSSKDLCNGLLEIDPCCLSGYLQYWHLRYIPETDRKDSFCKLERVRLSETTGAEDTNLTTYEVEDIGKDKIQIADTSEQVTGSVKLLCEKHEINPVWFDRVFRILGEQGKGLDVLLLCSEGKAQMEDVENNQVTLRKGKLTGDEDCWRLTVGTSRFPGGRLRKVLLRELI